MAFEPLSFHHYVKEAFNRTARIPMLGRMPLNKMTLATLAVLGLWNPGFWFLGAAGEILFLFLKATSPRFQKLIEGERLLAAQDSWAEKIAKAVEGLTPESRERYRRLLEQCRLTLGISDTLDSDSLGNFRDLRARSLNQLLTIFLRLLTSHEVIKDNVHGLDRQAIEAEIADLEERLGSAPEGALARSLQGTLDIQRKRLENMAKATENLEVIEAELRRIEQQVELIREESAVSGRPEVLSMRLDAVTSSMTETSRWIDEHSEFFDSIASQSGGNLARLPELPPMVLASEEEPPPDEPEALTQ